MHTHINALYTRVLYTSEPPLGQAVPHTVAVGLPLGSALQDSSLHLQLLKEAVTLVAQLHQETCQKLLNAARFTINLPRPAARGIQEEGKLWDDFMSRIYGCAHGEVHLCGSLSPGVTLSGSFISLQTLVKPRSRLLPCNNKRLISLVFPIRLQKWLERGEVPASPPSRWEL